MARTCTFMDMLWNGSRSSTTRSRRETQPSPCPPFFPSEVEQLPQAASLRAAHRNLCLFLIVHAQLVGTFEPGHNFADVIDVDQKRSMRAPEQTGIEVVEKLFQRPAVRLAFQARVTAGGHRDDSIFDGCVADILRIGQE